MKPVSNRHKHQKDRVLNGYTCRKLHLQKLHPHSLHHFSSCWATQSCLAPALWICVIERLQIFANHLSPSIHWVPAFALFPPTKPAPFFTFWFACRQPDAVLLCLQFNHRTSLKWELSPELQEKPVIAEWHPAEVSTTRWWHQRLFLELV